MVRWVIEKVGMNLVREGQYCEDLLFKGSVKGDGCSWKNIDITYEEGMGSGTYNDEKQKYSYRGGFIDIGDYDGWHGKGVFTYESGEIREWVCNRDV